MASQTDSVARERDLNSLSVLTVTVVLATVTMTFGAIIAVFLTVHKRRGFGAVSVPRLLWVTTAILLASSATLEAARRHLLRRDQPGFFRLITWTTALWG